MTKGSLWMSVWVLGLLACTGQAALYFEDGFGGSSLDSRWTVQTEGDPSSSVTVNDSKVTLQGTGGHARIFTSGMEKSAAVDAGTYASGNYLRLTMDLNGIQKQWSTAGIWREVEGEKAGFGLQSRDTEVWFYFNCQNSDGSWDYKFYSLTDENDVPGTWTYDWYTDRIIVKKNGNVMLDAAAEPAPAASSGIGLGDLLSKLADRKMYPFFDTGGSQPGTVVLDRVRWESVPEPATLALLGLGLVGLYRRKG